MIILRNEKLELLSSGLAFDRNNWNLFVESNFSCRQLFWRRFKTSRGGDLGSRFLIERRKRPRFSLSLYIRHWSPCDVHSSPFIAILWWKRAQKENKGKGESMGFYSTLRHAMSFSNKILMTDEA